MKKFGVYVSILLISTSVGRTLAAGSATIYLWGHADETRPEPRQVTKGNVTRIQEVVDPALVVFEPAETNRNGAAVVVCPGGGYRILAVDKEGYEVAAWLNALGYTAFVLQYSVPDKQAEALKDIQRAVRVVRARAGEWHLDRDRIGVMGFSAGGSLSARLCSGYATNHYDPVDKSDSVSSRPDFALLVYPAYLDLGENRSLTPELQIDEKTPPMFLFATADDKYSNSALVMATALRDAKVPMELHMLSSGGHGYGLREGNSAAETWPALAEKWLAHTVIHR